MLRKVVCVVAIMVLSVGVVFADQFGALITKVDGNKVTFYPFKDKQKGEEKTMKAAKDVKIVKAKFNKETKTIEAGDEIEGGLKSKMFAEIPEKGIFGQITTDDDNKRIKEIRVFAFKKKKE
jgi:hypothetical protein